MTERTPQATAVRPAGDGWPAFRVKPLRIQRRLFRDDSRELTRPEYLRLLETARTQGRERLALLLETICGTGIRVSEVRYVTVEAVYRGRAEISLKGKIRTILLPGKLCRKLLKYARKQKIASGEIFLTRNEKGISRRQIWAEMKALCDKAGVAPSKVFPHNLRHLFAKTFYRVCRDVARLAARRATRLTPLPPVNRARRQAAAAKTTFAARGTGCRTTTTA